jgi:acetyl-CoA carboxylase carboxyl transferase subunit alpha
MELSVPTLAIIIGEGGSGGAIALASSIKLLC